MTAININTLATLLKVRAVPGEALHIRVLHKGKEPTQGIGYLDDGTMIVVENAVEEIGKRNRCFGVPCYSNNSRKNFIC